MSLTFRLFFNFFKGNSTQSHTLEKVVWKLLTTLSVGVFCFFFFFLGGLVVDIFKSVFHNWGQSVTSLSVRTVERELFFDRILKRILVFLHSYIYFGSVQKRSLYIFCVEYKKVKKTTSRNFKR